MELSCAGTGGAMTERTRFERLALPHMDAVFNLAFWLLRSRCDAEDAVQDAYLRAYRGFSAFEGEDIRPWLLRIVRNVAFRKLADHKRSSNVISFDAAVSGEPAALQVPADEASAEDMMIGAGERLAVKRALAELAPIYREVVVLREIEAMSYRQIAELAGVPIGTVMSRLARARGELRKALTRMREDERNAM